MKVEIDEYELFPAYSLETVFHGDISLEDADADLDEAVAHRIRAANSEWSECQEILKATYDHVHRSAPAPAFPAVPLMPIGFLAARAIKLLATIKSYDRIGELEDAIMCIREMQREIQKLCQQP